MNVGRGAQSASSSCASTGRSAAVFLPKDAPGKRPVTVFLHGRHEACFGGTPNRRAWPCGPGQTDIPSYLGYNAAATALASHGTVVVSISAKSRPTSSQ